MKNKKWLYTTHPGVPRSSQAGCPLKLVIRQEVDVLRGTIFKAHLSVKYRDEAKPIGFNEQVSVEWVQNESFIDPVKFGQALIGLGEGLVKHGASVEDSESTAASNPVPPGELPSPHALD